MALILCPECGQTVSDQAVACPHCGYPMEKIQQEAATVPETVVSPVAEPMTTPTAPASIQEPVVSAAAPAAPAVATADPFYAAPTAPVAPSAPSFYGNAPAGVQPNGYAQPGYPIPSYPKAKKPAVRGTGLGIAGMVMGILACCVLLGELETLIEGGFGGNLGIYPGLFLFSILALAFGGSSMGMGCRKGMTVSGVIMGTIALAVAIMGVIVHFI